MHPYLRKTFRLTMRVLKWIQKITLTVVKQIIGLTVLAFLAVYYLCETLVLSVTPASFRKYKNLSGKNILVTGGAGGVGQELAIRLAKHKANVIIWDNNEKALDNVKEKIEAEGYKVHTYPVDITNRQNVYKYAEMVKSDVGPVDILINNAGVVCGQTFLELPDYMIEKTFNVNILSHYWTTKAFLPNMIKAANGHIVTISSLTGLQGTYKCTDYSASKHATIGFHESLMTELKVNGHDYIKMTLICPYFINTGMFSGCKPRKLKMLEPKDVARRIITAIKREEEYVTLPGLARFILPLKHFLPAKLSWALIYKGAQTPQAMMSMRRFEEVQAA